MDFMQLLERNLVWIIGLLAQAVISHYKIRELERRFETMVQKVSETEKKSLEHIGEIKTLKGDITKIVQREEHNKKDFSKMNDKIHEIAHSVTEIKTLIKGGLHK